MVDANQGKWMRRRDSSIVMSIVLIVSGLIEAATVVSGWLFLAADILMVLVGVACLFVLHQKTSKTSIRQMVGGLRIFIGLVAAALIVTIVSVAIEPAGVMLGNEILAVALLIISLVNGLI